MLYERISIQMAKLYPWELPIIWGTQNTLSAYCRQRDNLPQKEVWSLDLFAQQMKKKSYYYSKTDSGY